MFLNEFVVLRWILWIYDGMGEFCDKFMSLEEHSMKDSEIWCIFSKKKNHEF